jgi:hypothetical protein
MDYGESRTFRNRQMMVWCGVAAVATMVGGFAVGSTARWWPWPAFAMMLLVYSRRYVTVHATEIEIHKVLRSRRVPLGAVERLSVIHSRWYPHYGWRIRLHAGPTYVDTCSFVSLVDFGFFGATYDAPPGGAPSEIREMYGLLLARRATLPWVPMTDDGSAGRSG